jgi:SH3 domain protein
MKEQFKRIVFIGFSMMCFSAVGYAEDSYVTDVLKLTLRRGPGTEYKILTVVESGQKVEILESGEEWSRVTLANGKEGYVLTRYLTPNPTHSVILEQLQSKHDTLTEQAAVLLEENSRLKEENQKLKSAAQSNEQIVKNLSNDYKKLKTESAEFLNLKSKYKKVSAQLAEQTQKANALDEELSSVEKNQYIKWFLAGSGVLLVGFIVGFSARRGRRRPSLL